VASTLFVSDLHLGPEQPGIAASFRRFLDGVPGDVDALYILGDLFETWIGDDDLALPFYADIVTGLMRLAARGVAIHLMPGNRDFLMGADLAAAAGLTLLDDPTLVDLYGTPTLLAHGDAWCTDDAAYQAFRAQVRGPHWRTAFLAKPRDERRAIAASLRERSEQAKAGKAMTFMDVNADAVTAAFREHGVSRIIHGHTHRPGHHRLDLDGQPCERWVLPDWYDSVGGYLVCDGVGCHAESWR
jgi:UDP-2,3-diacylglucosamine hydrolase